MTLHNLPSRAQRGIRQAFFDGASPSARGEAGEVVRYAQDDKARFYFVPTQTIHLPREIAVAG